MRLETMTGPGAGESRQIARKSVVIGRGATGDGVDVTLADDPALSPVHARVFEEHGTLWVEDAGSEGGTHVNRTRLRPREPRPILPSDRLEIGSTILAVGTDRLVHLRFGPLSVLIESLPLYGHAFHHAAIPLVSTIAAWNLSNTAPASAELSVSVPGLGELVTLPLDRIRPGERQRIEPPASLLTAGRLEAVAGRTRASVRFSLGAGTQVVQPVSLLSAWEWPHHRAARVLLAAYVLPGDVVVQRVVHGAGLEGGWARAATRAAAPERLAAARGIYDELARTAEIHYTEAVTQTDPELDLTYQDVRAPDSIFVPRGSATREANCLDLSLLLAACFERMKISPLIILTGDSPELPDHALVGFRTAAGANFRPLLDRDAVVAALAAGEVRAVEATGICAGAGRLRFDDALVAAERSVAESRFVQAVEITACRPPYGRVSSLQLGLDPIVARAYHEAEAYRARHGIARLETSHLLWGVLAAEGELIQVLLTGFQGGLLEAKRRFESLPISGTGPYEAEPTANYSRCQEAAVRHARLAGSASVRESDLLWAILLTESQVLKAIFQQIGLSASPLADRLRIIAPPVIESTRPR